MPWNWTLHVNNYSGTLTDNTVSSTPDAGPKFKRQVSTYADEIISGKLKLNQTERDEFRAFYLRDTKQGELSFNYYDPILEQTRRASFHTGISENRKGAEYIISLKLRLGRGDRAKYENWTMNGEQVQLNGADALLGIKRW